MSDELHTKLLAACVEYRAQLDKLEQENASLRQKVNELMQQCSELRAELIIALTK